MLPQGGAGPWNTQKEGVREKGVPRKWKIGNLWDIRGSAWKESWYTELLSGREGEKTLYTEEENWGIHIALGEDGTAGRFWNRNVRTVSSEKWKHTYCVSAIKCASLYLSEKSSVVFLSRVENHKRNVSDTVVFPFRHFTFACKEASKEVFLKGRLFLLYPELQGAASGASLPRSHTAWAGRAELDQRAGSGSDTARHSPGMSPALRWVQGQARKSVSSSGSRNGKRN